MTEINELPNSGFFARHETFCPRYGWLKKGFDGVLNDSDIFDAQDAIEKLGVGKNMVRAIRFWGVAFKIIEPDQESGQQRLSGPMRATRFGERLLSDKNGWDPFLEDPGTLWLLHWKLFVPPIAATAWSYAINLGVFSLKDLEQSLIDCKKMIPETARYSDSSLEKDASCFTRMYAPPKKRTLEDVECPFTQLGLLLSGEKTQMFRFDTDIKPSLPNMIFLTACLDYARHSQSDLKTLGLNKIVYHMNSPGAVFKLSETDVGHRLEHAAENLDGVLFTESYGNRQLQFEQEPENLYWEVLTHYFKDGGHIGFKR